MYSEFLPYINVQEGLGRVLNNKKLYARLLKIFPQNVKMAELDAMLCGGRTDEAREAAHTLKGVAANLSVNGIFEASRQLEMSIKEGADCTASFSVLKQNVEATMPLIEKLIQVLEN